MTETLRIIPIGGCGEVGKNMTLIQYGDEAIAVDCGVMFPENDMLGIDLVIPDVSYLKQNPDLLKAILLTHGHEDHIGALPYVLPQVSVPLYATTLTRGLIEVKLREAKLLNKTEITTITTESVFEVGPFKIEPFHVPHSIPDAVGYAIYTPAGLVVHTGEYKFDPDPIDGRPPDIERLTSYGDEGVLALISDSTNSERPGSTPSEQIVSEAFEKLFTQIKGRVIVSMFASNISRIQQVINTAAKHDRKLAIVGRSMVANVKMARFLGYLDAPEGMIVSVDEINHHPDHKVAIVCTGTQGEPTSALVRMANDDHRQLRIKDTDTVILSATAIPGNEELVHRTIDNLFRLGANVIYQSLMPVHVSGHGAQEEQKKMLRLIRPQYFIPTQGEYRMLVLHGRLGEEVGIPKENIFIIENGDVVEFDDEGGFLNETVDSGNILIDGLGIGDIGSIVLRDRRLLSRDGFVVVTLAIDSETRELVGGPDIVSRGFVYVRDAEDLLEQAKKRVAKLVRRNKLGPDATTGVIRDSLSQFLYQRTHRNPMIFPMVIAV
ncbi:ribonuclease J [Anaerolineales bacterium HSG6]|nr:ribonuclease J [Anaerolineales bacterium HSG6]MDM8531538.1 ribonuclease J [Anaerolineales bacterium HSG25]